VEQHGELHPSGLGRAKSLPASLYQREEKNVTTKTRKEGRTKALGYGEEVR
jgi:hypothetical protein